MLQALQLPVRLMDKLTSRMAAAVIRQITTAATTDATSSGRCSPFQEMSAFSFEIQDEDAVLTVEDEAALEAYLANLGCRRPLRGCETFSQTRM